MDKTRVKLFGKRIGRNSRKYAQMLKKRPRVGNNLRHPLVATVGNLGGGWEVLYVPFPAVMCKGEGDIAP